MAARATMRAITCRRGKGGPEVLQLDTSYPRPQRKPGQALVRVICSSVNPIDVKLRSGGLPVPLPKVLGRDLAGVIEEADAGSQFKPGDRVFGLGSSAHAEYAALDEKQLARIPEGASYEQAAALPLVGLTAMQALDWGAGLQPGQRLLMSGDSR